MCKNQSAWCSQSHVYIALPVNKISTLFTPHRNCISRKSGTQICYFGLGSMAAMSLASNFDKCIGMTGNHPGWRLNKQTTHNVRRQLKKITNAGLLFFYGVKAIEQCRLSRASSANLNIDTLLPQYLFLLGLDLGINLRTLGGFIAMITCLCFQDVSHMPGFTQASHRGYFLLLRTGSVGSFCNSLVSWLFSASASCLKSVNFEDSRRCFVLTSISCAALFASDLWSSK